MMIVILILLVAFLVWTGWGIMFLKKAEQPPYTILEERRGYEVRSYEPYLVAQVAATGEYVEATRAATRVLIEYFAGKNVSVVHVNATETLQMTSPVSIVETAPNTYVVLFVIPSSYAADTLPKPQNNSVVIASLPARTVAVYPFRGYCSKKTILQKKQELLDLLQRDHVMYTQNPIVVAQYAPSFVPPFIMKNEIQVELIQ